jgi:hypothetical protein
MDLIICDGQSETQENLVISIYLQTYYGTMVYYGGITILSPYFSITAIGFRIPTDGHHHEFLGDPHPWRLRKVKNRYP